MGSNVLLFGWNRPFSGREHMSAEHFQDFVQYLHGLQKSGDITSFEIVFLDAHGGDMNGFFLLQGDSAKLDALVSSDGWETHVTRATFHLEGFGVVRGVTGERVTERMNLWKKLIPA